MLDALRFVTTAVARKDYLPELTHYKIRDGRVTGFNGIIALSSDIDVDLDVYPRAMPFLAAIRACPGTITLGVTPAGKLAVRSEKFRSFVDCLDGQDAMFVEPEGDEIDPGPNFIEGLKALSPLMGIDASRPWAMGIKVMSGSMFATNNVMLAEYWHGADLPVDVVIPSIAVEELLRIDEVPTKIQVTDRSMSFWFGENRWLRTALVEATAWPIHKITELFNGAAGPQLPITNEFKEAVEKLKPFVEENGTIFMSTGQLATSKTEGEGTSIEIAAVELVGIQAYHQKHLALLGQVADTIDWTTYPRPCVFYGKGLRGVIIGQRVE